MSTARRTFPLLELARLAAAAEGGATPVGQSVALRARVTALDALRALPVRGAGVVDDVDDPSDGGYARHRRMVRAVDVVTLQVARLLTVAAAAGRTRAAPAV